MVEDILKAASAYRGLSPIGKRLFREETGLTSTKRRTGRRRTATKAKTGGRSSQKGTRDIVDGAPASE